VLHTNSFINIPLLESVSGKMSENLVFVVKSTIKVSFPDGHDKPGYGEMLKFAYELGLEASDIFSIYQEYTEKNRALYIKLKEEALVQDIVGKTFEANFKFDSGAIVKVQLSEANGNLKYVRIFNLIPEVDDESIAKVLKDYGTVKKQVREKFPASFEVDIFTGVRGVYMELNKPLPPYLSIGNMRAKFYYQGMSEGCFYCNGTDHIKLNCPKKITPVSRAQQQTQRLNVRQADEHLNQQQRQQPKQAQQALTLFNSPLHFPTLTDVLQKNSIATTSDDGNRLFAPNNTLSGARPQNKEQAASVEVPTTSTINNNTEKEVFDWLEIESDENESGGDNEESSGMIIDESLAETQTTNDMRLTRSTAAKHNATARSRSNSLKKTIKAGQKPKKIKTDVLERIAKSNDQ
jgi:hypothetical protein